MAVPQPRSQNGQAKWREPIAVLAGGQSQTLQVAVTLSCGDTYDMEAEVNPAEGGGRAIDESGQYANNVRRQTVTVSDEASDGGDGRSVLGAP